MSHILLIDDDEDMLAMTERWLKKAGYEVSTATSGRDAVSFLSDITPELILLDYAMPEMDGPAVLRAIRSDERLRSIPVLYRTGMDDGFMEEESGDIHPDGVIPKSEGKPFLMKAVEDILAK